MSTRTKKQGLVVGPAAPGLPGTPTTGMENPVTALRRELGVSQESMARLLDVSLRTLSRLEAKDERGELPRSFHELRRLSEGLLTILRQESLPGWLARPNDAFGGAKPVEIIERGEVDRLWRMIHQVGGGEPA